MSRIALAWITLVSFLIFSWSCYSWQKVSVRSIELNEREGKMISAVQATSGEKIELKRDPAASIRGDSVVGQRLLTYEGKTTTQAWAPFSKPLSDIDFVWVRKLNIPMTFLASIGIPLAVIFGLLLVATKGGTEPLFAWGQN